MTSTWIPKDVLQKEWSWLSFSNKDYHKWITKFINHGDHDSSLNVWNLTLSNGLIMILMHRHNITEWCEKCAIIMLMNSVLIQIGVLLERLIMILMQKHSNLFCTLKINWSCCSCLSCNIDFQNWVFMILMQTLRNLKCLKGNTHCEIKLSCQI